MKWSWVALLAVAAVALTGNATLARTWFVNQAGGFDFVTISDACQAASSGDTIAVYAGLYDEYDGPYPGELVTEKSLCLIGWAEVPEDVRVRTHIVFLDCPSVSLNGFTFYDSPQPIKFVHGGGLSIQRCRFEDCFVDVFASAVGVEGNSDLVVEDCVFVRNRCWYDQTSIGGAIGYEGGGAVVVVRSLFEENVGSGAGAAIYATCYDVSIEQCVFAGNVAHNGPAAYLTYLYRMGACTIYENETTWAQGAAVAVGMGAGDQVQHCIFARTRNGYGLGSDWGVLASCSCFWDNERGATVAQAVAPAEYGNFEADPMFCNAGAGDFQLEAGSPCQPGPHGGYECSLIGALDIGCGASPAVERTWGQIKAMFLGGRTR